MRGLFTELVMLLLVLLACTFIWATCRAVRWSAGVVASLALNWSY